MVYGYGSGRGANYGIFYSSGSLSDYLENQKKNITMEIEGFDSDYVSQTSTRDVIDYLIEKYSIDSIKLVVDEITKETVSGGQIKMNSEEAEIDVSQDPNRMIRDRSRPFYLQGSKIEIFIPFTGDIRLFDLKPSTFNYSPPSKRDITVGSNEILFTFEGIKPSPETILKDLKKKIEDLKWWVLNSDKDIKSFNEKLPKFIEREYGTRVNNMREHQNLVASLGIPVKVKKHAKIPVQITSKRTIIRPEIQKTSQKQFFILTDSIYLEILKICKDMSLVMERSPRYFAKMEEEGIRTHFLVQLNGTFSGEATGETFNNLGKTDILIRHKGKNIFISECKFWTGQKGLVDTINQLLGYTSWRDTKTAIFLFNTRKNFSNVLKQIPSIMQSHPNHVSSKDGSDETEFHFKFHHVDDSNRMLDLTVLVFDIPSIDEPEVVNQ